MNGKRKNLRKRKLRKEFMKNIMINYVHIVKNYVKK
jgi:hypothetical protein